MATNSGAITAANAASFPAFTAGSWVGINNIGPGGATVYVAVSGTWSATLVVYYSPDGISFNAVPAASIVRASSGATGAIASASQDLYSFQCGPGAVYVYASAYVSGPANIVLWTGVPLAPPGVSGGGNDVTVVGPLDGSGNVKVAVQSETPATSTLDATNAITSGGTAQSLFGGATPTHGYEIINLDPTNVLWVNDTGGTASANGANCFEVFNLSGSYTTPFGMAPSGAISVFGAVTGQKFLARYW